MLRIILILAALLLIALPVVALAQDVTPEPTPAPVDPFPTVPPVEEAGSDLIAWLLKYTGGAEAVTALVVLMTFLKRLNLPVIKDIPANTLLAALSIIFTAGVWISRQYGVAGEFSNVVNFGGGIIELILTYVGATGANYLAASAVYLGGKATGFPLLQYQRPSK